MRDRSVDILSDITTYMKYAKYLPEENRRETFEEMVTRNKQMHIKKFPELKNEINEAYTFVSAKKVLPSMRSMQFAGKPIEVNPARINNCSYMPVDDYRAFSEAMFLLLAGCGVGYSIQRHHVEQLPEIVHPNNARTRRFLIGDSIEGWADSIKALVRSYYFGGSKIRFDYSDIRSKGTLLVTSGGKAPGPQPLRECLVKLEGILEAKEVGTRLTTVEVHDIMCHIADAVLAGGIRRAAMIALFSADDEEMLGAKAGNWWESNPQRGRANNSVLVMRHRVDKEFFMDLLARTEASKAGEPGISLSNDKEMGFNPCHEISLKNNTFCNLVEINASDIENQEELNARARAGAFIATLQASYTDFHYLRGCWQRNTERDALIGVSMTGIASGAVLGEEISMKQAAQVVKDENSRVAELIGIRPAARTTAVKPAGTTSLVLGTSSGIHAWHAPYYIRRIRVGKNEAIYHHLAVHHPELVEDEFFRPHDTAVISIPQRAPEGAIIRDESAYRFLERVKKVSQEWVSEGHRRGSNKNNVSATVSVRDNEWGDLSEWMWKNRDHYTGLSLLPYDDAAHTYKQAPFEECSKETYEVMMAALVDVDITAIVELEDNTTQAENLACAGGTCAVV
jgi:ribonucleoside-triphosphate reductase (thioredoxin)